MIATAFIIGFFSAFGFWAAGKVTTAIDKPPVKVEQKQEKESGK